MSGKAVIGLETLLPPPKIKTLFMRIVDCMSQKSDASAPKANTVSKS